jgi:hypothetical protein
MFRFALRLLLRIGPPIVLFVIRQSIKSRERRAGRSKPVGQAKSPAPLDRKDVVDVPFTEIPRPPDPPRPGETGGHPR